MVERRSLRPKSHNEEPAWRAAARVMLAIAAAAPVIIRLGWPSDDPLIAYGPLDALLIVSLAAYAGAMALWAIRAAPGERRRFVRGNAFEFVVLAAGLALSPWWWAAPASGAAALLGSNLLRVYLKLVQSRLPPGVIFVGSFMAMIVVGAAALKLPSATPAEAPVSVVDALFTSTSAVCVTGLTVRDTATEFTRFGQTIILILIQLGGLGIVFFGALLALLFGSSFGLRATRGLAGAVNDQPFSPQSIRRLIAFIVAMTLTTEAIGAATLFVGWPKTWAMAPAMPHVSDRLFHSVFFAVSSFCNAGFATTSNSLHGLRTHWTSHLVIATLIVIGGLGFPALDNLRKVLWAKMRGRRCEQGALVRLSLHTRLVLTTTVIAYLMGFAAILIGRLHDGGQGWTVAVMDAHFMSITARTAGFDTASPETMGGLSRFALMSFMFLGGSPGSTAGGIKTIVVAVLVLTVWSTILGRDSTTAFGRRLSDEMIRKAATLMTLGVGLIVVVTAALALTDGGAGGVGLESVLFEAISACSTVGLTLGITPDLSEPGRLTLVAAMFLGRVGPLAMLVALMGMARTRRPHIEYPAEGVLMS